MVRENPNISFERYADKAVCHCVSRTQAENLQQVLNEWMNSVGLELHPEKTKIVYCKDDNRHEEYVHIAFDFLGYTFRSRTSKADPIAQMLVKEQLVPELEKQFHPDSYGYRPNKSALEAVGQARKRCWKSDWVLDLDIPNVCRVGKPNLIHRIRDSS